MGARTAAPTAYNLHYAKCHLFCTGAGEKSKWGSAPNPDGNKRGGARVLKI